jgi:hypothetical protein
MVLMVANNPESFSIINLFNLLGYVFEWNKLQPSFLGTIFDLASTYVQDNKVLFLFYVDKVKIKIDFK